MKLPCWKEISDQCTPKEHPGAYMCDSCSEQEHMMLGSYMTNTNCRKYQMKKCCTIYFDKVEERDDVQLYT